MKRVGFFDKIAVLSVTAFSFYVFFHIQSFLNKQLIYDLLFSFFCFLYAIVIAARRFSIDVYKRQDKIAR